MPETDDNEESIVGDEFGDNLFRSNSMDFRVEVFDTVGKSEKDKFDEDKQSVKKNLVRKQRRIEEFSRLDTNFTSPKLTP
jgi:hypothetical protein